jgi:hypothetical protein
MDGCEIKMGRKSSVRCHAMLADCAYSTPPARENQDWSGITMAALEA